MCFLQNFIPVKVETPPRQPFDYNGKLKLSHTLRVGKAQMTHPSYSLAGKLWDGFHLSMKKCWRRFAEKGKQELSVHVLFLFLDRCRINRGQ